MVFQVEFSHLLPHFPSLPHHRIISDLSGLPSFSLCDKTGQSQWPPPPLWTPFHPWSSLKHAFLRATQTLLPSPLILHPCLFPTGLTGFYYYILLIMYYTPRLYSLVLSIPVVSACCRPSNPVLNEWIKDLLATLPWEFWKGVVRSAALRHLLNHHQQLQHQLDCPLPPRASSRFRWTLTSKR